MSFRHWRRVASAGLGLAALAASATSPIARAEDPPTVRYIALGDSFTAAPLSSKPSGTPGGDFRFDASDNPYTCGQSNTNYPRLIARWLGFYTPEDEASEVPVRTPHPEFIDASCGGARTEHMTKDQHGFFGRGTNKAQFDAFKRPGASDVELVTLGIGGNDLGFGELQGKCVEEPHRPGGKPCHFYYENDDLDNDGRRDTNPDIDGDIIQDRLKKLAISLDGVLTGIKQRAPRATVLVFGYPDLLPQPREELPPALSEGCYPYIPVLPEDAKYLREAEEALNATISQAAGRHGATYVDWSAASRGHDMCQPPGRAWVNGIVLAPPSIPVHPNVLGSAGAANAAIELLKDLYPERGGLLGGLGALP